jgi:hypothetical protein
VKQLLGYSVEESREDPELWNRILHPDDRERVIAEERRTSATGEPFRMEYRMIARGGRVVWGRDEAVLVRGQGGRPRFWQGVIFDTFGTGYSSLSYLKRFPVEYLKIDRSFVGKLGEDPDDTALVSGVIGLAHTLSFEVVAEGVEAAEQLAKLREAGCDLAQGYYLSKPLPSEAAKTLLAKRFPLVDGHP